MTLADLEQWFSRGCPVKLSDGTLAYADCEFSLNGANTCSDDDEMATVILWSPNAEGIWREGVAEAVKDPPDQRELPNTVELDFQPRQAMDVTEAKAQYKNWQRRAVKEKLS